jgi:uncharacterized membrane protein YeaQ/YmgE (transglycosylase-associated protein family)
VKRIYFVLPDVESARRVADDLLLARVDDKRMHFLARRGTDLGDLREATYLQKSDLKHSASLGLVIGAVAGVLLGSWMVVSPPDGMRLELVTVLLATLGGAFFGMWAASMVGASAPNSQLSKFASELEGGKVLLMVDVPSKNLERVRERVAGHHPEADSRGVEPTMPAFP